MDQQFAGSSPVLLVHFLTFIRFLSGDAIVPITNLDLVDRNDADDMLYTLDPFREKVPGMVVIGKDA